MCEGGSFCIVLSCVCVVVFLGAATGSPYIIFISTSGM